MSIHSKVISDELPAGMNVYILFLLNLGATGFIILAFCL